MGNREESLSWMKLCACVVIVGAAGRLEAQTVLRVDASSTDPAPDGSSWATAYASVDDALDAVIG